MLSKVMIEALQVEVAELRNKRIFVICEGNELRNKREEIENELYQKGQELKLINDAIRNMDELIAVGEGKTYDSEDDFI